MSTTAGDIASSAVVNCAGAWSRKVASLAGVACPLLAYKHAYVVTEPIPGLKGLPSIRDYDAAVYMKVAGESFHIGGYELNPVRLQTADGFDIDDDASYTLFDLDYDVFGVHLEAHIHRVPSIESAGIASTVNGPESFTPDHRPLMGEAPDLRGFLRRPQLGGHPLLGRLWPRARLVGGDGAHFSGRLRLRRPPLPSGAASGSASWLEERSHETYANQSIIPLAYDQPLAGRNARTSPFHDDLVAAGCVHVESHGFERARLV